jgi:hypothetical protein
MKHHILLAGLTTTLMSAFAVPIASAQCDISQTKCALNDGKCNIKFINQTGLNGKDSGTNLNRSSSAQTIRVKALKTDGNTAGNALSIDAGASKTMNLDKKANKHFDRIRISSPAMNSVIGSTISCASVQAVLNGNGTCKIFHGAPPYGEANTEYQLGYRCDSGETTGPKG